MYIQAKQILLWTLAATGGGPFLIGIKINSKNLSLLQAYKKTIIYYITCMQKLRVLPPRTT